MTTANLLALLKLDEFVVIDLETTGFSAQSDKIIELGAVRFVGGEPAADFRQLVNPGVAIPGEIVVLTNISDEMVADEPALEAVADSFIKFVGSSPIVAQNISFDLSFFKVMLRELHGDDQLPNELYDTLPLARTYLFHRSGYSLGALCAYFGIEHTSAHRAYHDALNTGHIFIKLLHEAASYPLPVVQSLLAVQDHVQLPNKQLYVRLIDAMSAGGRTTGLTDSEIEFDLPRPLLNHDGAGESYVPKTPEQFFGPGGILSDKWEDYEPRPAQMDFSDDVSGTLEDGAILLAEAGTGLGKSMAYLLPAINSANLHGVPVVIASHTKHLQDQLFRQELPRVVELLDAPVRAVMLKGRTNYLCRTRLQFALDNARRLLNRDDCERILPILLWEQFTRSGDIEECPGFTAGMNVRLWRLLRSERGYCLGHICQRYGGCFVGPLRRAVKEAGVIVINQALLLADAAGEGGILPAEFRLVLDEAHNLPKVATEQLTVEFSAEAVRDLTENYLGGRHRRIFRGLLKDALLAVDEEGDLGGGIIEDARELKAAAAGLMEAYMQERNLLPPADGRQLFQQGRYIQPSEEFRGLETQVEAVGTAIKSMTVTLKKIQKLLADTDMSLPESLLSDIESDYQDALALQATFGIIAVNEADGAQVLWRELRGSAGNLRLLFRAAPLWVNDFLRGRLFEKRPGTVLCSATLQVNGEFDYFRREVGLESDFDSWEVREQEFASPFMYEEQCIAFFWDSSVDVNDENYPLELANLIDATTDRIHRRMLVLFTSYAQLRAVHEILKNRLRHTSRELLTQYARSSRWGLLDAFKLNPRAILLGTSSFWEGVDLPGELLEIVIMARLPFANPSDPVVQARIEYFREAGMNPFMDYQIPEAVTRFRQGFGRLIRTTYDEGIFIIADSRVARKRYGGNFLDALPLEAKPFSDAQTIVSAAQGKVFQQLKQGL